MLALLVTAQSASAQDACTYDECALKVTRGFLGTSILKGTEEERVARIILLAPHLDLFAQRSDSAGLYYEAFRGQQNRSTWFLIGGAAAFLTGPLLARENETAGIAITVTGIGALVVAVVESISASNKLTRAVWWYNRGLPGDYSSHGLARK